MAFRDEMYKERYIYTNKKRKMIEGGRGRKKLYAHLPSKAIKPAPQYMDMKQMNLRVKGD